jgi:hypothetical protein
MDEKYQAGRILESLLCELLDVIAPVIRQAPALTDSSDFADRPHAQTD